MFSNRLTAKQLNNLGWILVAIMAVGCIVLLVLEGQTDAIAAIYAALFCVGLILLVGIAVFLGKMHQKTMRTYK